MSFSQRSFYIFLLIGLFQQQQELKFFAESFSFPTTTTSRIAVKTLSASPTSLLKLGSSSSSSSTHTRKHSHSHSHTNNNALFMSDYKNDGVVELVEDDEADATTSATSTTKTSATSADSSPAAPFLSQGEIQKEALELSNDPKQTRVIIYIIISLLPVLFLVPLMLGSRDLIPLDALPPVELN